MAWPLLCETGMLSWLGLSRGEPFPELRVWCVLWGRADGQRGGISIPQNEEDWLRAASSPPWHWTMPLVASVLAWKEGRQPTLFPLFPAPPAHLTLTTEPL